MTTWWLSFCDTARPKGQAFLGVILVDAPTFLEAVAWTHSLRVSPGGEVNGYVIDETLPVQWEPVFAATPRDTLLSRADLDAIGHRTATLGDIREGSDGR